MHTRTEKDTMGTVEVPTTRYWGAQTQRSIQNFSIGAHFSKMPIEVIHRLCYSKKKQLQRLMPLYKF